VVLTAHEEYIINLYAPSIAYRDSWESAQQVSRVTFNQYWSFTSNLRRSLTTLNKLPAAPVLVGGVALCLLTGLSLAALYYLRRKFREWLRNKLTSSGRSLLYSLLLYVPKAPRLVGIETNPGPSLPEILIISVLRTLNLITDFIGAMLNDFYIHLRNLPIQEQKLLALGLILQGFLLYGLYRLARRLALTLAEMLRSNGR
jgi:hypothetical protein